jgi:hypothetical protein
MKTLRKAVLLAAAILFVSPAMAQDPHAHHKGADRVFSTLVPKEKPMCAEGSHGAMGKSGCCGSCKGCGKKDHAAASASTPETVWEKDSAAAMASMHHAMDKPYTGDADADFIRGMIPHHQGAVEMARIVLKYGDDEPAKALARRIIVAQKGEIAWMQRWLRERQIPETGHFHFNK